MLGKLAGQDQADTVIVVLDSVPMVSTARRNNSRGLNLPGRDGGLLVVGSKLAGLGGDALEDVCEVVR